MQKKQDHFNDQNQEINQEQQDISPVTTSSNSKKGIIVMLLILVVGLIYFFWSSGTAQKNEAKKVQLKKQNQAKQNVIRDSIPLATQQSVEFTPQQEVTTQLKQPELTLKPPSPPPPPPIVAPLPPPIPELTFLSQSTDHLDTKQPILGGILSNNDEENDRKKKMKSKMQASSMVFGGGSGGGISDNLGLNGNNAIDNKNSSKQNEFLGFDGGVIDNADDAANVLNYTSASRNIATKVGMLEMTILQGKIVDAVLETAINTAIPGMARAIVTRDVYSEHGKNILLPKGSRLIGSYSTSVAVGQTRVNVTWDRVITPYGIDIAIESTGSDQLGRAGIYGDLDEKLFSRLANAFLISYLIPYLTTKATTNSNDVITTTTTLGNGGIGNTTGGGTTNNTSNVPGPGSGSTTTTQGSPLALAIQGGNQQFTNIATDAINNTFSTTPVISVDQGTKIKILVQKDLVFPSKALQMINERNY